MKRDSEVFREARDLLVARGKSVATWESSDGRVCVNGACNIARHGVSWTLKRSSWICESHEPALQEAMQSLGIDGYALAMEYNDAPSTTVPDLCELLERAEKLAEQREAS